MISETVPFSFEFMPNVEISHLQPERGADTLVIPVGDQLVNPYGNHGMHNVSSELIEYPSLGSYSPHPIVGVSFDWNGLGAVATGIFINKGGLDKVPDSYKNEISTFTHPDLMRALLSNDEGIVDVALPVSQFERWWALLDAGRVFRHSFKALVRQDNYDLLK